MTAEFPAIQCLVVPVNDLASGYDYPPEVRFEIAVTAGEKESEWTATGWDAVECRIATNAGDPLKPYQVSQRLAPLRPCSAIRAGRVNLRAIRRPLLF